MRKFIKQYPLVVAVLIELIVVLILAAMGQGLIAQIIATVFVGAVVLYTAYGMVKEIIGGHFGLDILAVVAMVASLAVGEYIAASIIVLMLTGGDALEDYASQRAKRELTALLDRAPQMAHRLIPGTDNQFEDISADDVAVGDTLLVRPAEIVPVDGELIDDTASFDESSLTGEPLPVHKSSGDTVLSGSVNGQHAVRLQAQRIAQESQFQRIVSLVKDAEERQAPVVRLADRYAVPFTVLSLLIAGVAWALSGNPVRFAEVLVLATPCPLLIAAPVAFTGGMSRASRSGIIVKGGTTLEALARAKSIAFDKTGTLTHGHPEVVAIRPAAGVEENELLLLTASAEQYSSHVLADGILRTAAERKLELLTTERAKEIATNGVEAHFDGRSVRVGKFSFIAQAAPAAQAAEFEAGETAVYVAFGDQYAGALILADALRTEAAPTVQALTDNGFARTVMLTGDNEDTARSLAAEAGVSEVHAALLPEDKVSLLTELEPRPVIMVGDGVNDAPVLAVAEVGIAMGARGSTAASESADAVITADDIGYVVSAVDIGRRTYSIALQSIWIGIIMSVGLMLVAAFGFIPAVVGALTQEVVDLVCILYALLALKDHWTLPRVSAASREAAQPAAAVRS